MDISNKALSMFLLAAIVVSLGGTIVSLNKLGSISTTGYATTDTGTVQLTVAESVSITTNDADTVNFGTCTPYPAATTIINSENGSNTSGATAGICTMPLGIQNISVRNDGTVNANVNISASDVGENAGTGSFLAATPDASDIAYKATNASRQGTSSGGCSQATVSFGQYINFTTAGQSEFLCGNLTWGTDTANSIVTDYEIVVPSNVPAQAASVTITFAASTIA